MAKQDPSPLVEAAASFDEELATYARLGELFLKTPLSSVKHLERSNGALAEPAVQQRNHRLQELMAELTAVAGEVGALNTVIQGKAENGDATVGVTKTDALDLSERVLVLSERAEKLAAAAREADYEELATQAHALHQRLATIGKKLQKVGGD